MHQINNKTITTIINFCTGGEGRVVFSKQNMTQTPFSSCATLFQLVLVNFLKK